MRKQKIKSATKEWVKAILIGLSLFIIIRTFLFAPVLVDGKSMESTLQDEDRLIVTRLGNLERFDIVVFHANDKDDYIKRVIGLPGDTIAYVNDQLFINGEQYNEEYIEEDIRSHKDQFGEDALYTGNFTLEDKLGFEEVPEDTIFVMGDNRPHSWDSRDIGVVPLDSVIGEARVLFWPFKNSTLLTNGHKDE
ncbi:signal peptidase I [Jeotgalibacillus proteolyticus]|uniref:signal peptidase I n=1 Tax=Jeotgalibacillus proteolyticus TaxID=2082395 RepID=UPI0026CA82DD